MKDNIKEYIVKLKAAFKLADQMFKILQRILVFGVNVISEKCHR